MESLVIKASEEKIKLELIYMDSQGETSYRVISKLSH